MIRRAAVLTVIVSGLIAVALVGPQCAAAAGLATAAVLGAPVLAPWVGRIPWALLTLGVLAAALSGVASGGPPTAALGLVLVYLQVHGRLTREGADDDRKALVLAALMLVTGAGATREPLFGLAVVLFGAALPAAATVGELGLRTAARLALVSGLVAAGAFVVAPRSQVAGLKLELTGFAAEVELGALDELLDDPAEVFRAAVRPPRPGPVYWRGVALDTFDGTRWFSGSTPVASRTQALATIPFDAYVVEVEPADPGVVFTAGWPLSVEAEGAELRRDDQNGWSTRGEVARYRIVAQGPTGPADRPVTPPESDPGALRRALQLPPVDPRLVELAAAVAGEGTPREQAERLADWLRTSFVYTRAAGDRADPDPLATFVLDRRAGHCEYFASALAVMLRTRGIPARVVNGFVGGEVDPQTGWTVVRRSHAHSWVEVHDRGWWLIDPTPGPAATALPAAGDPSSTPLAALDESVRTAWDDGVLTYDRRDQVRALIAAARAAERLLPFTTSTGFPWRGVALLGVLVVVLTLGARFGLGRLGRRWLEPRRSEPTGPVARAHHRARALVAERGYDVPRRLPPLEAARWVRVRAPGEAADALVALAWLYYEVHLGQADPHAAAPEARRLLERVRGLDAETV